MVMYSSCLDRVKTRYIRRMLNVKYSYFKSTSYFVCNYNKNIQLFYKT